MPQIKREELDEAIELAVKNDDDHAVEILLDNDVIANQDVLIWACSKKHISIIKKVLEQGILPKNNAFCEAMFLNDDASLDVLKLLLNSVPNYNKTELLETAVCSYARRIIAYGYNSKRYPDLIKFLIKNGAYVNRTMLEYAMKYEHFIKEILEKILIPESRGIVDDPQFYNRVFKEYPTIDNLKIFINNGVSIDKLPINIKWYEFKPKEKLKEFLDFYIKSGGHIDSSLLVVNSTSPIITFKVLLEYVPITMDLLLTILNSNRFSRNIVYLLLKYHNNDYELITKIINENVKINNIDEIIDYCGPSLENANNKKELFEKVFMKDNNNYVRYFSLFPYLYDNSFDISNYLEREISKKWPNENIIEFLVGTDTIKDDVLIKSFKDMLLKINDRFNEYPNPLIVKIIHRTGKIPDEVVIDNSEIISRCDSLYKYFTSKGFKFNSEMNNDNDLKTAINLKNYDKILELLTNMNVNKRRLEDSQ
jgi:hypothetical protein